MPAWPRSGDQRRRNESRRSWSTGSSSRETCRLDSGSTWDSWASKTRADLSTACPFAGRKHTIMDLLTTAKNIADRVEAESVKQNVPVAVTVIDIHGNVVPHPPRDRSARVLPRA